MAKRVEKANRINAINSSIRQFPKGGRKDFKSEMNNLVRNNK
jgi:hypothetical protein